MTSEAGPDLVEQAIRQFQEGTDRSGAFRFLYETYFFALKGFSQENCFNLIHETIIVIYKAMDGYEHRQRFTAWLFRVAETVHLKRRRTVTAVKRAAEEVSRDGMENPDTALAVPGRQ